MQYIKHYYIDEENNNFCCTAEEPKYKRQPWKEYVGLDVKVWLSDSDGVDVMLSEVPDTTYVENVSGQNGKNGVQVLTQTEFNSVFLPYSEANTLYAEAEESIISGDESTYNTKKAEAETKMAEAISSINSL